MKKVGIISNNNTNNCNLFVIDVLNKYYPTVEFSKIGKIDEVYDKDAFIVSGLNVDIYPTEINKKIPEMIFIEALNTYKPILLLAPDVQVKVPLFIKDNTYKLYVTNDDIKDKDITIASGYMFGDDSLSRKRWLFFNKHLSEENKGKIKDIGNVQFFLKYLELFIYSDKPQIKERDDKLVYYGNYRREMELSHEIDIIYTRQQSYKKFNIDCEWHKNVPVDEILTKHSKTFIPYEKQKSETQFLFRHLEAFFYNANIIYDERVPNKVYSINEIYPYIQKIANNFNQWMNEKIFK